MVAGDELFDFVVRVDALRASFYNVVDDPLVGFVSRGPKPAP